VYHRPVGTWMSPVPMDPPAWVVEELKKPRDYTADLKKLLGSANICDKRWVFEQYDSMVQSNTVQGPGGEAGVMRIKETGSEVRGSRFEREKTGARAGDGAGGQWAVVLSGPEAGRDARGGRGGSQGCLYGGCAGGGDELFELWQSGEAGDHGAVSATIDGIAEACTALGTPITGGNVSF